MEEARPRPRVIGRYALHAEIAAGGMASVHLGRLLGPVGFARTVAIKRLHAQYAKDPEFVAMFMDEARLAARIRHPNVVATLDVVAEHDELFLVMDYVEGESLSRLARLAKARGEPIPVPVAVAVLSQVLQGLHAAHEAKSEAGDPLDIVHRDVSPQNVLVGVDGVARVLDFGIAKAAGRLQTTREGQLKGKVSYMPVEQIQGAVTRRTDIYSAGVVLWELLVGRRLFQGADPVETLNAVVAGDVPTPSTLRPDLPQALDAVVLKALSRDPRQRWGSALEFARALEGCVRGASAVEVGEWVHAVAGSELGSRAGLLAEIESESQGHPVVRVPAPVAVELELESAVLAAPLVAPPAPVAAPLPAANATMDAVEKAPPSRRGLVALVVVLAVALVAAVVFAATSRAPGGVPSAPSPPPVGSSASASATSPAPSSAPSATSVAPSAPSSSPPPPKPPPSVTATKPAAKAPPPKPNDCNPPYWLDKDGKKHFKDQCPLE